MQNLGFCYQLLPALRRLYGATPPAEVLQRYTGYFNTHPFFAPWVAGTILRLEEQRLTGAATPVDGADFQKMVMAPYAAIGDALFWGALRPLAAVVGLFLAVQGIIWAPLVMLTLFNVPHLLCRCCGWPLGYLQELRSAETLQRLRLPDAAIWLKEGTIILLGVLCAMLAVRGCEHPIEKIRAFQEEARECAAQMTANGGYILRELGNVRMSDELRQATQALCADLGEIQLDLLSEILDINRLLEEDGSDDQILARVGLIEKWAQDEAPKMHGIVTALDAEAQKDVMRTGAYLLVSQSAVNILKPLKRMRGLAAQLRGELG